MGLTNVTVSVPEDRVSELLHFAAELTEVTPASLEDDASNDTARAKPGFGRYAVRKAYVGGVSQVWRPMLEYLADRPDEWVAWPEICEAVNRTPKQMSGALGAAERRVNNKPPYEKRRNSGVREFRMPASAASLIREVAAEQK